MINKSAFHPARRLWRGQGRANENYINRHMQAYKKIDEKISYFTYGLIGNGVILLLLGVLIVWTDFMLRLVVGLVVIIMAYGFFYIAYKVHSIKKELNKFFRL